MEMTSYERSIFERVKEKFWKVFRPEEEITISFLEGLCQVFDLQIAFRVKREGNRLKILDIYPEGGKIKKGVSFEMDEGVKTIIEMKSDYSCNRTEENSSLKKLGIDSFLVVPLEVILDEYLFICNRMKPAQFEEVYISYDLILCQALAQSIPIFPMEEISKKEYLSVFDKTLKNIYEQVSKDHRLIKETHKFRALLELSRELNSPGEPAEILTKGLELIVRELNSKTGCILLRDEITQRLKIVAICGENEDKIKSLEEIGFVRRMMDEGEVRYLNNVTGESGFDNWRGIIKSILACPISIRPKINEKRIIGVIVLLNKPIPFREEDKEILSDLSEAIGISIQSWFFFEKRIKDIVGPYLPTTYLFEKNSPLHQVRRENLSILFADMTGFTRMIRTLGRDEVVIDTLNQYFTQMSEIVFEREGILDKFIGDGIMAIFGSAENALLAAFDMKDEFDGLKERLKEKWESSVPEVIEINVRFGIATDWVFIGDLGSQTRKSYTAVGPAVNLACRLVSEVDKEKVWIDAPTYQKVKEITTEPCHSKKSFKGFDEINVYEIVSIKRENPEKVYSEVGGYIQKGLLRRALINLDRLIRRPGSLDLNEIFLKKAGVLKEMGEYKGAIKCYDEVLATNSNSTAALKGKAECLDKLGVK